MLTPLLLLLREELPDRPETENLPTRIPTPDDDQEPVEVVSLDETVTRAPFRCSMSRQS